MVWRRGRDSNPRAGYPARRFRGAPVTTTSVPLRLLLRSVGPLDFPTSLRARGPFGAASGARLPRHSFASLTRAGCNCLAGPVGFPTWPELAPLALAPEAAFTRARRHGRSR